jgi:hypothetical protein
VGSILLSGHVICDEQVGLKPPFHHHHHAGSRSTLECFIILNGVSGDEFWIVVDFT